MRCCVESVLQAPVGEDGAVIQCIYSDSNDHRTQFVNGAWEWTGHRHPGGDPGPPGPED